MAVKHIAFLSCFCVIPIVLAVVLGVLLTGYQFRTVKQPDIKDGWWGKGDPPLNYEDSINVTQIKVSVADSMVTDLKNRINNTRYGAESFEGAGFTYGAHADFMKLTALYWRTKYDWKKREEIINKFNHFHTQIEGLSIHFLHVVPNVGTDVRSVPILLVHGWPGAFTEFYKLIPMLTKPQNGMVFEVVVPSIPGYTFSEAPHKKGFDAVDCARVFHKLMRRLGYKQFYTQGGDWGSAITSFLARMYPGSVKGIHLNMIRVNPGDLSVMAKMLIGSFFPNLVLPKSDHWKVFPVWESIKEMLLETGYAHLQATKPDTIGHALTDSPVGLAAYMMEKYSTWTNIKNRIGDGGGIIKSKLDFDELLDIITLYWWNKCITPSMRFYKEFVTSDDTMEWDSLPIAVPTALAAFPQEFVKPPPVSFVTNRYTNIVQYTDMPRGGHFAAMEEPGLLAEDVWKFVAKVETMETEEPVDAMETIEEAEEVDEDDDIAMTQAKKSENGKAVDNDGNGL